MAINEMIPLQAKVGDPLNALASGYQLGNTIRQQPMVDQMNQQKLQAGEIELKDAKMKQMEAIQGMAKGSLQADYYGAVQIAPYLASGDMASVERTINQRKQAKQLIGMPTDTEDNFLKELQSNPEQAKKSVANMMAIGQQLFGGAGQTAWQRQFDSMTQGMTPEDRAKAQRIAAGLDPRAVASAPSIVDIGGVKYVTNPMSGTASLPVLNQGIPGNNSQGAIPPPIPGGQSPIGAPSTQQPAVLDANAVAANAATIEKQTTIAQGEGEQVVKTQKSMRDESEVNRLLDKADGLIDVATGSKAGQARDAAMAVFGASTAAGDAAAELRTLEGALVMQMPRMEGPQSNLDQQLYRQMAAQVGDPGVPASQKKAAMSMLRSIMSKYQKPENQQQKESSIKPQIQEGATATNPQTGQRIIFRGGQWQTM